MLSILGIYNTHPDIFDDVNLPEDLSKDVLIDHIILECGELELLYSQPKTLKAMLSSWSTASQYTWNKLAESLTFEYNPIWNKDGTVTETETLEGEGEGVQQVSAFDSESFENRGKNTASSSTTRTYSKSEQGNIGVTSTQQLIKEEREISMFNIYDQIVQDFKQRFCIMVY